MKEAGDTWTKIESGNVTGYVKNEYCVTGTDEQMAQRSTSDTVAKVLLTVFAFVKRQTQMVEVVKTVASGEHGCEYKSRRNRRMDKCRQSWFRYLLREVTLLCDRHTGYRQSSHH